MEFVEEVKQETIAPETETIATELVNVVVEKQETKPNFVKDKMTVTLNKKNLSILSDYVNRLPEDSGIGNITQLLMHLVSATPVSYPDLSEELETTARNLAACEDISEMRLERIEELEKEIQELKTAPVKESVKVSVSDDDKLWFEKL